MAGCNRCHGGIVVIKTAALSDPKGYIERDFPCHYCFPVNRLEAVKKLGIKW
jgi:hypothetical protein